MWPFPFCAEDFEFECGAGKASPCSDFSCALQLVPGSPAQEVQEVRIVEIKGFLFTVPFKDAVLGHVLHRFVHLIESAHDTTARRWFSLGDLLDFRSDLGIFQR